ncbi:MAG TPA: hypothetical protein VI032_03650, partial [Burkholderiaceae bacterium]
ADDAPQVGVGTGDELRGQQQAVGNRIHGYERSIVGRSEQRDRLVILDAARATGDMLVIA